MRLFAKILLIVGVCFILFGCASRGARPAPRLAIEEAVLQHMGIMYLSMQGEWAMCLRGSHNADTNIVRVDDISAGLVLFADSGRVIYKCYTTPDIIGSWHTHPSRNCAFSPADSAALAESKNFLVSIVSCGMPPTINVLFHPSIRDTT